jgi:hypothetical protein
MFLVWSKMPTIQCDCQASYGNWSIASVLRSEYVQTEIIHHAVFTRGRTNILNRQGAAQ